MMVVSLLLTIATIKHHYKRRQAFLKELELLIEEEEKRIWSELNMFGRPLPIQIREKYWKEFNKLPKVEIKK